MERPHLETPYTEDGTPGKTSSQGPVYALTTRGCIIFTRCKGLNVDKIRYVAFFDLVTTDATDDVKAKKIPASP